MEKDSLWCIYRFNPTREEWELLGEFENQADADAKRSQIDGDALFAPVVIQQTSEQRKEMRDLWVIATKASA